MKKAKWLVLLLAVVLAFSLVSCNKKPSGDEEEIPTYATEALLNWLDYSIVYPEGASSTLSDAAVDFVTSLRTKYGSMPRAGSDFLMPGETAPVGTLEILIGNTNREESKQVYETLRANDYFIGMVNNRLLIIGGSEKYTLRALEHFMSYLVADEGLLYPAGEGYTRKSEYTVDTLTIGGVDVSDFVIVRGNGISSSEKVMTAYLQELFASIAGADVPIVAPSEKEVTYEILVGNTRRAETAKELDVGTYAMEQTANKLALYGNGDSAITFALREFINETLLKIPKGKSYDIKIENVFGEEFVAPTLINHNLPSELADISEEYDNAIENVDSVMDRFFITKDELPDEVTIIDKISIDDYPASKAKKQVYVSANSGDDANSGTKKKPVKTIAKAIELMNNEGGGAIWIEGGTYFVDETVKFSSTNSGTILSPLFVIGYGDEKVTITTNQTIDGSKFKKIDAANDSIASRIPDEAKDKVLYVNLFENGFEPSDLREVSISGHASVFVDGEEFTLARYPNAYYEDGTDIDPTDLLYFTHVYDIGSVSDTATVNYAGWVERVNSSGGTLTLDSVIGWEIRYPNKNIADGPLSWINTGDIWYYGNVYSGWEFEYYNIDPNCVHLGNYLGTKKDDGYYSLKSVQPCRYGALVSSNSAAGRNVFYLFNAIEALDAPGEWFVDKETGNLYIYPKSDNFAGQKIAYSGDDGIVAFQMLDVEYAIVDNIHIDGTGGAGMHFYACSNVVVQNISTKNTVSTGFNFQNSYNCALIHSEFSNAIAGAMVAISGADSVTAVKPSNIIIQNNVINASSATSPYGLSVNGCRVVVSHNTFLDCCMTNLGLENIIEYNEFAGGNRYVTDGGMIYMTGSNTRGHHIRFNLFHKFHATHNAVYNDGKSSGIYAYGNIVSTLGSKSNFNKGWYSSSGHGNVCYANIMIFRSLAEIADAKGLDYDEATGKITQGDSINQSGLFYYYYGDGDPRNNEAGHWWKGDREAEIKARFNDQNTEILKQRFPEYMANFTRIKLILKAYEMGGYMPTYAPQQLSGKQFVYADDVEDGEMLYIPEYEYINANGQIAIMPERTLVASNGRGFTVTLDDIAAMERLERQPAFAFISNNLILGGLREGDTLDDVITNDVRNRGYAGFIEGMEAVYNNYYQYDYSDVMPNIKDYNYTIPESAWNDISSEMNAAYVRILQEIDYTRMGKIK